MRVHGDGSRVLLWGRKNRPRALLIGVVILMIDGFIAVVAMNTLGLKVFVFSCLTICFIGVITSLMAGPSKS